jgi:hypothetical protein
LLALIPPGCSGCRAEVEAATAAASLVGVDVTVVEETSLEIQGSSLIWRADVAELYDAKISLQLVLMGKNGVITARGDTSEALLSALAELAPDAAGTPIS